MNSPGESIIPPQIMNALYKQENYLKNNPINGITYYFNENDITDIQADTSFTPSHTYLPKVGKCI